MNIIDLIKNFFIYSDEKLKEEAEKARQKWNETHNPYYENKLSAIGLEMTKRANKKYDKEHPNSKPRHKEHGWYLPEDD